jgi:hypothetical protein
VGRILYSNCRSPSRLQDRPWFQCNSIGSCLYLSLVGYPSLSSVKLTFSVGTLLGFLLNFAQDWMYKRNVATKGVEARLYGALFAGPGLAVGCIIFGLTAIQSIHWIAPCVGLVIILSTSSTSFLSSSDSSVGIYDLSSLFRLPF